MATVQTAAVETAQTEENGHRESTLLAHVRKTPWLLFSALLHVLLIALASLVTLTIAMPETEDFTVRCVVPSFDAVKVKSKFSRDTVSVDAVVLANSNEASDIVVPPDDLDVSIGDHFETIASGQADLDSSVGNPDAPTMRKTDDDNSGPGGGGSEGLVQVEDVIGAGPAAQGHNAGWGGGRGNSLSDEASSFSQRRAESHRSAWARACCCGCPCPDNSVEAGLRWLSAYQDADGHWDTVKLGSTQKTDTAMTAMALLTFAGAGYSERVGKYSDNVKRAVAWLKSKQRPSGLIFDATDAGSHRGIGYPHAIATLALAEAAGMGRSKDTISAAQRAVDACEMHQAGSGSDRMGWRYDAGQAGDLSVTGWYIMALKSAKIAGLHVDSAAFEGAMKFLDSVEIKDPQTGASRYAYQPGTEHSQSAHLLTAIGTLARQFCGRPKQETQESVEWFVNKGGVPEWNDKVDLYYWYYGSLSTFQQGGDPWKRFNHGLIQALTKNQCKTGDNAGSWPVVGEFSDEWGRVGQTAIAALCLEVYYRYERVKN